MPTLIGAKPALTTFEGKLKYITDAKCGNLATGVNRNHRRPSQETRI